MVKGAIAQAGTTVVAGANDKAKSWLYFVIYFAIIVVVIIVVVKIYKAIKSGVTEVAGLVEKKTIETQTGVSVARQYICEQVAVECRDAMTVIPWTYSVFHISEDLLIESLNKLMSAEETGIMCTKFKEKNGFSIGSKLKGQTWLGANFKDRVKAIVWLNLK